MDEYFSPEFITFAPSHSTIPPEPNFGWAPDESYGTSSAMAGPSCGYEGRPPPATTATRPIEGSAGPWVREFGWAPDESYATLSAVAGPSLAYGALLPLLPLATTATRPIEEPVGSWEWGFQLGRHEGYSSSNPASEPSFGYDAWPPATTATQPIEGPVSHGPWYGIAYQPEPIDLPPTMGVPQDTTCMPNPTLGTMQVLLNSISVHDPAIQERDKRTDPLQFADFGSSSSTSGPTIYPVVTTLASASNLKAKEVPSHKGKPQRRASRSQRPAKIERGRRPGPHSPGKRPPRIKFRGEELDIAEKIRDRLLEESRHCDGHEASPADRIECGPCYRRRLDGGQNDDWEYIRPELNALAFASTSEARMPPDEMRISKNLELIPDGFKEPKKSLLAHMEAMRGRPWGAVPLRDGVPRPWRVTRTNGIVVVREKEDYFPMKGIVR